MNWYEIYHIVRREGTKEPYCRTSAVLEAENVFEALEQHRLYLEEFGYETAGGLVTHRIVGGVGQPVQPQKARKV